MRIVIQRVAAYASVTMEKLKSDIKQGYLILLGIEEATLQKT